MIAVNNRLFELGQVVATPNALEAVQNAGHTPREFLSRQVAGDWGMLSAGDKQANDDSLVDGSRLLSAYLLKTGQKIWIITEAVGDDGKRASTCLMFPDEY